MEKNDLKAAEFLGSFTRASEIPGDSQQICFLGRSNSGKSSLLSRLIHNSSLVKISSKPGSTRTVNAYQVGRLCLVDLPGYGYAKISRGSRDTLSEMIAGYLNDSRRLLTAFLLVDCRRLPEAEEEYILNTFRERGVTLNLVFTKIDKLNQKEMSALRRKIQPWQHLCHNIFFVSSQPGKERTLDAIHNFLRSLGI